MSYKRKDGTVISRRDWERLPSKELQSEFSPSGDPANKMFDGDEFIELDNLAALKASAPPANEASSQDNDKD